MQELWCAFSLPTNQLYLASESPFNWSCRHSQTIIHILSLPLSRIMSVFWEFTDCQSCGWGSLWSSVICLRGYCWGIHCLWSRGPFRSGLLSTTFLQWSGQRKFLKYWIHMMCRELSPKKYHCGFFPQCIAAPGSIQTDSTAHSPGKPFLFGWLVTVFLLLKSFPLSLFSLLFFL